MVISTFLFQMYSFFSPPKESWLIGKDCDAGRNWGQEEKGTTEDEMAGWHHRLDGHEFEWTPGVGDGQGGLACCNSWGRKESDTTEQLKWTESNIVFSVFCNIWREPCHYNSISSYNKVSSELSNLCLPNSGYGRIWRNPRFMCLAPVFWKTTTKRHSIIPFWNLILCMLWSNYFSK